ncbi:MAG: RagB/SusD family nutrient uptake outer membrane protein [Bacteroidetes bacterium]|nr:RagB/SusD family nutrient uptake outer membrane protein [Bacteroidota bacterium]
MKKILYSLCILAFLVIAPSCNDLLELKSPDKISAGNFYRNETDALSAIAVAYSKVGQREYYYGEHSFHLQEARTDLVDNADLKQIGPDAPAFFNFAVTSVNGYAGNLWYYRYRGISAANKVIENVPNISLDNIAEDKRDHILGEAKFLRAYYHFILLMDYKDVILRSKSTTTDSDKLPSSRADIWDFVIAEFDEAATLMSSSVVVPVERATANTAYAFEAWALVNRAYETENAEFTGSVVTPQNLTDALTAISKISGPIIETNYRSLFDGTNNNSKEVLLTCPFNNDPSFGLKAMPHMGMLSKELGGYHVLTPSKDLLKFYEDTKLDATHYDPRALATAVWNNDFFNTPGNFPFSATMKYKKDDTTPEVTLEVNKFSQVFSKNLEGSSFYKFTPKFDAMYDEESSVKATFKDSENPVATIKVKETPYEVYIPIMRYANVLLLKAECLAQTGGDAIAVVNELRSARGIAATKETDAMKAIELERILEFEHENSRFYDLRRWNKLATNANVLARGYTTEANFIAIPSVEIVNNEALNGDDEEEETAE